MRLPALLRKRLAWSLACVGATSLTAAEFLATGLVEPIWQATLAPTVLGRVESIAVSEGDAVEAGAVLLLLERSIEELDAGRRQIVAESTVEIDLARTKLEVLQAEFEGTRRLYEGPRSVSKEEFERARLDLRLAEAELAQLESRMQTLDEKTGQVLQALETLQTKLQTASSSTTKSRTRRTGTTSRKTTKKTAAQDSSEEAADTEK